MVGSCWGIAWDSDILGRGDQDLEGFHTGCGASRLPSPPVPPALIPAPPPPVKWQSFSLVPHQLHLKDLGSPGWLLYVLSLFMRYIFPLKIASLSFYGSTDNNLPL